MEHVLDLLLGPAGVTVETLLILFAGFKGWWVWGRQYKEMVKEKDEWKNAAQAGTKAAERAVELIHKAEEARNGPV